MTKTIDQIIESISIFGGLSVEKRGHLISLLNEHYYQTGEKVFSKGEPASRIYIVVDGLVGLDFEQQGHPLSDITIEQGHCFGETSLIGIQNHSATVYAIESSKLVSLSGKDLFSLYEDDMELFTAVILNIARESCRRLHATDELFLQFRRN